MAKLNVSGWIGQPLDEDEIDEKYNLGPDSNRSALLRGLTAAIYPETGYAEPPRSFPTEIAMDLDAVIGQVGSLAMSVENSFVGSLEIACADRFGVENAVSAASMIFELLYLEPRSGPLEMGPDLAYLLVRPIVADWRASSFDQDGTDLVSLARDVLAGRWDCSDEMLLPALVRALQDEVPPRG